MGDGKKYPDGHGMWIQDAEGLWHNIGKPGDLSLNSADEPPAKLSPPMPEGFTVKGYFGLSEASAEELAKLGKEHAAKMAKYLDDMYAKIMYDSTVKEPIGFLNATTKSPAWTGPTLGLDAVKAMIAAALPPYPPNSAAVDPLEEPPPPTWRQLAAAFEMASARILLEAPERADLEAGLSEHFGSTDPVLKAKE